MAQPRFKNALVSCSEKAGLAEFLKPLQANGLRIVSTGGTARYLREHGLQTVDVSEQTGFPEVMDGRVKTLHPHIHMALLGRNGHPQDIATLKKYNIEFFDLVIGNLYPFEADPDIENIDIGGPSFLRAAAKNFERITVICDPADYNWISSKDDWSLSDRQLLAAKVFSHTASYDSMIAAHYAENARLTIRDHGLGGEFVQSLRYGENPVQKAAWFRTRGAKNGLHKAKILQGKELSYNNLLDLESAVSTVREFPDVPACVAVKHNSPCGVGTHAAPIQALQKALAADPQSVFGAIVAVNFNLTGEMAEPLNALFLECVIAPSIEEKAREQFAKKKNLRVLTWPDLMTGEQELLYRTLSGGFLIQTRDQVKMQWDQTWQILGQAPTGTEKQDLLLAWKTCAHLKSNAIAIASQGLTVGLGMGQVNRVDAVAQAIERMQRFHPKAVNPVLASDAFFPFPDSVEKIASAGIKWIIQPGGSVKDPEVIKRASELGVTMVLTGQRHFLH